MYLESVGTSTTRSAVERREGTRSTLKWFLPQASRSSSPLNVPPEHVMWLDHLQSYCLAGASHNLSATEVQSTWDRLGGKHDQT